VKLNEPPFRLELETSPDDDISPYISDSDFGFIVE
jgi:hypothetical protein